jgi:Fur family peroxide stress response transcriptional regulator
MATGVPPSGGWASRAAHELKRRGYKLTPQRLKILEILERMRFEHPTFTRILEAVRREMPTVSTSTLYSFLLVLDELGLVHLFSWNGETRVEVNPEPHVNVIESGSGRIRDIWDKRVVEEVEALLRRHGIRGRLLMLNAVITPEEAPRA